MTKLKSIIDQLSQEDYECILQSLEQCNAAKSVILLKTLRTQKIKEIEIQKEINVNKNAYYTLRSRLGQKIEDYLLHKIGNPKIDVLRKVSDIPSLILGNKKEIAIAALKKLEKEVLNYDLSAALPVVYQSLKELHIGTAEYYDYSKLYNQHIANMMNMNKAKDLMTLYFQRYGFYLVSGDKSIEIELKEIVKQVNQISKTYDSHRLYVYKSSLIIFHKLFLEGEETTSDNDEPLEDMLSAVQEILEVYNTDPTYRHLRTLFMYLKMEYYMHYKIYKKAEEYFMMLNPDSENFINHYYHFTFPHQLLISKLKMHRILHTENELYNENSDLKCECDESNLPKYLVFIIYKIISCYYANEYQEGARIINNLLNQVSLKQFPLILVELKTILALLYALQNEYDLFDQTYKSIHRKIRTLEDKNMDHIILLTSALKLALNVDSRDKTSKIEQIIDAIKPVKGYPFSPTSFINLDKQLVKKLSSPMFASVA